MLPPVLVPSLRPLTLRAVDYVLLIFSPLPWGLPPGRRREERGGGGELLLQKQSSLCRTAATKKAACTLSARRGSRRRDARTTRKGEEGGGRGSRNLLTSLAPPAPFVVPSIAQGDVRAIKGLSYLSPATSPSYPLLFLSLMPPLTFLA